MNIIRKLILVLTLTCTMGAFAAADVAAQNKKPPEPTLTSASVSSRLANLTRLVNSSTGADRIARGDNARAKAKQAHASQLVEDARKRHAEGDLAGANKLLNEATQEMFSAIRLVGLGKVAKNKKLRDFTARAESVDALLSALQRIAKEKHAESEFHGTVAKARKDVAKAMMLKREGRIDKGRNLLDQAYVAAKSAIEQLRRGDTLVRSLNFANKEEEYRYELDRNDTHQMLVKYLLEEKMKSSKAVTGMVDKFLKNADKLRRAAEDQASRKSFSKAVESLEKSTKELVRAIRGAGVYIPG